jgi:CysZ protein
MSVTHAFGRAFRDLFQPRVLAVLLLPMLGSLFLWSVLAWVFWAPWTDALRAFMDGSSAGRWLTLHGASWVLGSMSAVTVFALLMPAVLITAIVITELVAMPVIVSVAGKAYPGLSKQGHATVLGSLANALTGISIFSLMWIVTLPLWLTGIGALVLPALTAAYLNQRLFRFDALAEHATREEYRFIVTRTKLPLYGLGLILALLYYVPFVNLIAPVLSGLAFSHLCLGELTLLRRMGPS